MRGCCLRTTIALASASSSLPFLSLHFHALNATGADAA